MSASSISRCAKFLFHFAHDHLEFRLPEIRSIADMFEINFNIPDDYDIQSPYLVVELSSLLAAQQIMSRTVAAKSMCELWASGSTYNELYESLRNLPVDFTSTYTSPNKTFRIHVDCFNKQKTLPERIALIENLVENGLMFEGRVDLGSQCDNTFHLLEYYGPAGTPATSQPISVYFGRLICEGQRDFVHQYELCERKFIGNTSMDPHLSLIMANLAQVNHKSLVCDPFVGTGSLLVACAHFGASVMGTDIDYNLLIGRGKSSRAGQKWRSKDESIRNNLRQYGLERHYIDTLVADASLHSLWRRHDFLDAIIADPPYGIREPTQKLGSHKENVVIDDMYKEGHIPCKTRYNMTDIISDLLNFAAKFLVIGGRLVFWIPVCRQDYKETNIPQHPCFHLVANCEQVLNRRVSRRLLTMHKAQQPQLDDAVQVVEDHYKHLSFRDRYFRPSDKDARTCRDLPPIEQL